MPNDNRLEISKYFSVTEMEFQDNFFQFANLTKEEIEMFEITPNVNRPYQYDDTV